MSATRTILMAIVHFDLSTDRAYQYTEKGGLR